MSLSLKRILALDESLQLSEAAIYLYKLRYHENNTLTCWTANLVLDYSTKWHQLPCMDSKHLFTHSSNPLQWFPSHCTETNRVNFNTGWEQASCRPFYCIARLSGCQNNEDPPTAAAWPASKEIPLCVSQGSSKVSTPATVQPDLI